MRSVQVFIDYHSSEDLMVLGFFLVLGATVAGWILDVTLRDRGFGVVGNGILILLGGIVGIIVAQAHGPTRAMTETKRILAFSTASAGLVLIFFCMLKAKFARNW